MACIHGIMCDYRCQSIDQICFVEVYPREMFSTHCFWHEIMRDIDEGGIQIKNDHDDYILGDNGDNFKADLTQL